MPKRTLDSRIKAEKKRLTALFTNIPADDREMVAGLIDRAAWQRPQLEDLEADIALNGWTMQMQQSRDLPPFERVRPQASEYQKLHTNYLKTIKDLKAWLPRGVTEADDGFDALMNKYDGV